MANIKNNYRSLPMRKVITIILVIIGLVLIILYANKWEEIKEQEKYLQSYLISSNTVSLEINDINEIDSVLSETPSYYFVYISFTKNKENYELEQKLKPLIDEYNIQNNFYFINVTNMKDENKNYKKELADKLNIDKNLVSDIPVILYFKNGELASSKKITTSKEFEKLLEEENIKSY